MNEKNYIERYWRDAKPEDALVEAGWWWDDDVTWIRLVLGTQDPTRRELGPAVQIDDYEAGRIVY